MHTDPITSEVLRGSVIAVPPLARTGDLELCDEANRAIIAHIEGGGVTTLLYGGNANLYHIGRADYAALVAFLAEAAGDETVVIPSAGPAFGTMMEQAELLAASSFPTVMVLPMQGLTTSEGVREGLTRFAKALGRPVVLYIKADGYIEPEDAARLVDDGQVSWIKYATVREDPSVDPFLARLVEVVDPAIIVSGIGEQPAIVHRTSFGLAGFTSGCVCVNPAWSQEMLGALNAGDPERAEAIRARFEPLEDLRNAIHPVRVLHEAVALAGIAETGPHLPLLSALSDAERTAVREAAVALRNLPVPAGA